MAGELRRTTVLACSAGDGPGKALSSPVIPVVLVTSARSVPTATGSPVCTGGNRAFDYAAPQSYHLCDCANTGRRRCAGSALGEGMPRRSRTFRIFVSSTFSDFVQERNALQQGAFPQLREYCQQRGARFQAIDLRWGVSQEASLDQQTMNICTQELRRCQELSPRPNFIVLLGDRYGWRPLPAQIEAAEFEALVAALEQDDRDRLEDWYKRDDNAVPPEYCLKPCEGQFVDRDVWQREEDYLREILQKGAAEVLAEDDPQWRKYVESATHQEIRHGALEAEDPQDHVFCYFRMIEDLPDDETASLYRDIREGRPDQAAEQRLAALRCELKHLLPEAHVHQYDAAWRVDHAEWDMAAFCDDVRRDLQIIIDQELAAFEERPELEREIEEHRAFAEERADHFVGRADLLETIRSYIDSPDASAPLVVHGPSGLGKTALLARAWLDLGTGPAPIARFIGATPGSADLRLLLAGLCRQMGIDEPPADMNELVSAFRDRLSSGRAGDGASDELGKVVLFLDALDQLIPTDSARMLYWLPREMAPDVRLVVSVLDAEGGAGEVSETARRIWPDSLVEMAPLGLSDAERLLGIWLDEAGRALQPDQRADVLGNFAGCPRPLYLKLAFEEARRWKSWEGLPTGSDDIPGLNGDIPGVLMDLFWRLEQPHNHGRALAGRALGYIGTARNGLTEDELLDVLSADEEVLEDFRRRSPTERERPAAERLKRLPVVVWSRLYADLEPYMTRRRADGTVVLTF